MTRSDHRSYPASRRGRGFRAGRCGDVRQGLDQPAAGARGTRSRHALARRQTATRASARRRRSCRARRRCLPRRSGEHRALRTAGRPTQGRHIRGGVPGRRRPGPGGTSAGGGRAGRPVRPVRHGRPVPDDQLGYRGRPPTAAPGSGRARQVGAGSRRLGEGRSAARQPRPRPRNAFAWAGKPSWSASAVVGPASSARAAGESRAIEVVVWNVRAVTPPLSCA